MNNILMGHVQNPQGNYRRLWLFSACAYKLRLQKTMRLTDNVRLTSGIIVATPSMRKHVCDRERCTNDKNGDDKHSSVRWLYESVIRGHHISKGYGLQEQERLYKFDKKQEPSWSKCCGFAQSR